VKYYRKYPYLNTTPSVDFKEVKNADSYHTLSEIRIGDIDYLKIDSNYKSRVPLITYQGCSNNIVDPKIIEYHQEVHWESVMRIEFNPEELIFFYAVYVNGLFVGSDCNVLNPDFSVKTNYSTGKNYLLSDVREYRYRESGDEKSLKIFFPELWHIDFDEY
jgi:hypothetical protein